MVTLAGGLCEDHLVLICPFIDAIVFYYIIIKSSKIYAYAGGWSAWVLN